MRTLLLIAVSVSFPSLSLLGCGEATPPADAGEAVAPSSSFDDPEVTRIHDRMMSVIAPDDGWDRARYLEFDWAVRRAPDAEPVVRSHRWDRFEGMARIAYDSDEGRVVAVFHTDRPEEGEVWRDDSPLSGEEAEELLRNAHRAHINDAYWLLMPFKWTDPGVHLEYLGEQTDEEGRDWEVVQLSFDDDTGYTPQNRYRAFINPETGRMERWQYFANPDADPATSEWADWRRVGPIELAENRVSGGFARIFYPHLRVETEVPSGAFAAP